MTELTLRIVIGTAGSGKSTIALRLAREHAAAYLDKDAMSAGSPRVDDLLNVLDRFLRRPDAQHRPSGRLSPRHRTRPPATPARLATMTRSPCHISIDALLAYREEYNGIEYGGLPVNSPFSIVAQRV